MATINGDNNKMAEIVVRSNPNVVDKGVINRLATAETIGVGPADMPAAAASATVTEERLISPLCIIPPRNSLAVPDTVIKGYFCFTKIRSIGGMRPVISPDPAI